MNSSLKASSCSVKANYLQLKVIFKCRLYIALHGREMRLSKYSGWERLILRKTEDECTGENFNKWLENTYALVKKLSGGGILKGLMIYNYYWDRENFIDPNAQLIIDALSIFITKMNPVEGKDFKNFNGFDRYICGEPIPLIETFPNRLCDFKLEYLTIVNCLFIQEKFDMFYLFDDELGATAKKLYDYIDNMVQMRIAIEIYGEKTGYTIIKEDMH